MGCRHSAPDTSSGPTHKRRGVKILVLGTGESGKSTFLKQIRILYGKDYSAEERLEFRAVIWRNVVEGMKAMLDGMEQLKLELADASLKQPSYDILDVDTSKDATVDLVPVADAITRLWRDSGVQAAYERSNEYQLGSSTAYFMGRLAEIGKAAYSPSLQDVLQSRVATTGIIEYHVEMPQKRKTIPFYFRDVGGQRGERAKWAHAIESLAAIIFIAACSEYDQGLVEQPELNRMAESIALFEQIVNYESFATVSFILFLNKEDLLREKVKHRDLGRYFPEFKGPANDAEAAKAYIKDVYLERAEPGKVKPHFTVATDTKVMSVIINDIKEILIHKFLAELGAYT